ncbi:MAG: T9SS type A sorting domain-containing protein [Prevotella sp.]|nr:T9SS type A sorting domain-containing protein [Prevotella sp.]
MKTKPFLTLLLLWTMIVGAMAEERSTLFVHLKDGTIVQFTLPVQKPVFSFMRGMMKVAFQENGDEDYVSFERDQVENLTIGTTDATAIEDVKSDECQRISFNLTSAGVVRISGLQLSDRLQVFSIDGRSVSAVVSRNEGEATIDLTQQLRGVYIVSVNQRFSFKLMKP